METIAQRILAKVLPNRTYMRATAALNHLDGNARPYFSLTGEHWQTQRHYQRRTDREAGLLRAGAMGDDLVRVFPELDIINRLHLADDTGEPMHAEANGWYFYTGEAHAYERTSPHYTEPTDTPHERAANALRVTPDELPEGLTREQFHEYVESLRPRWQADADEGRKFLDS